MIANKVHRYVRKGEIEKIENYEKALNDKTQMWHCHHRLELTLDDEFAHTPKELQKMGMYYNRPYYELIFLTISQHRKLHGGGLKESSREALSNASKLNRQTKQIESPTKGKFRTEFSIAYYEHFKILPCENLRQWRSELSWFKKYGEYRWESNEQNKRFGRKVSFSKEHNEKVSKTKKGKVRTEFGKKFIEKYGTNYDKRFIAKEREFYRYHGYCRWER